MKYHIHHIIVLVKRLLLILALFESARILFLIFNYQLFSPISFLEIFPVFFWGLRFDFAAIFYINILFIFLHLIPGTYKSKKIYQLLLKILFILFNSVALLPNFVDIAYYEYLGKRSTADMLGLFSMGNDIPNLLPQYLKDFWYVAIIWIIAVFAMIFLYPKINTIQQKKTVSGIRVYLMQSVISLFIFAVFFSITRGWELKPLRIISTVEYAAPRYAPLLLNTPFTILNTFNINQVEEKTYFSDIELNKIYNPVHQYINKSEFKKKNVVIIILESFSKAYIGALNNNKGYTPFLDSLIRKSLSCDNAFANGKRSIEALPSILSGLPPLMNEPFISSNYAANNILSIASILKTRGYYTSFFHGGDNGTMGFDLYAKSAGFDQYCGRKEYNNEADYDGNWGIYDEPFLQFFRKKINEYREPFFTCLFTLSSHHPYSVPDKFKNKFPGGPIEILKSIEYTDYALSKFFHMAESEKWYNNTLFVITADHTAPVIEEHYKTKTGIYAIPLIFYCPGDSNMVGSVNKITQQTDILPSVIDFLNYEKPFVSFGNSVFDSLQNQFALQYLDNYYQFLQDSFVLHFDGEKAIAFYNFKKDSMLVNNIFISDNVIQHKMTNELKAVIQAYNNRMVKNKLTEIIVK